MELYKEICLSESCKSCFTIDTISEVLSILAVKNLTCLIVHTLVISFMLSDVFTSSVPGFCLIIVTHFIWLNQGCLRLNLVSVYPRIWNAFKYSDYFKIWYILGKLNGERWQLYCYCFRLVCWGLLRVSNTISFFYKTFSVSGIILRQKSIQKVKLISNILLLKQQTFEIWIPIFWQVTTLTGFTVDAFKVETAYYICMF